MAQQKFTGLREFGKGNTVLGSIHTPSPQEIGQTAKTLKDAVVYGGERMGEGAAQTAINASNVASEIAKGYRGNVLPTPAPIITPTAITPTAITPTASNIQAVPANPLLETNLVSRATARQHSSPVSLSLPTRTQAGAYVGVGKNGSTLLSDKPEGEPILPAPYRGGGTPASRLADQQAQLQAQPQPQARPQVQQSPQLPSRRSFNAPKMIAMKPVDGMQAAMDNKYAHLANEDRMMSFNGTHAANQAAINSSQDAQQAAEVLGENKRKANMDNATALLDSGQKANYWQSETAVNNEKVRASQLPPLPVAEKWTNDKDANDNPIQINSKGITRETLVNKEDLDAYYQQTRASLTDPAKIKELDEKHARNLSRYQ